MVSDVRSDAKRELHQKPPQLLWSTTRLMQLILVCMEDTELSAKKKDDCQDTTFTLKASVLLSICVTLFTVSLSLGNDLQTGDHGNLLATKEIP